MPVATSADDSKHRPPRPKSGTAALVGLLGIVGVSGTILTLIMRRYSSLILLPPSFKRLQLDEEGVAQLARASRALQQELARVQAEAGAAEERLKALKAMLREEF